MQASNVKSPSSFGMSFEMLKEFITMQNKFKMMLGILKGGSVSPAHFYNHKSKTFLKNRRKELKKRNKITKYLTKGFKRF